MQTKVKPRISLFEIWHDYNLMLISSFAKETRRMNTYLPVKFVAVVVIREQVKVHRKGNIFIIVALIG